METKEEDRKLECVGSTVIFLANKYSCTRQYVTKVLKGQTKGNTVRAQKILADARDIKGIIERETKITI